MSDPVTFRAATIADAESLGTVMAEAFAGYYAFAPAGWTPPTREREAGRMRELLDDDEVWCRVAEARGQVVAQVTIMPATQAVHPADDPKLAHLRNLFVAQDFWGTGLASELDTAGLEAARERGYDRIRLFTPAGHGRARRFYEREGWVVASEPTFDTGLGMEFVEYRFTLTAG